MTPDTLRSTAIPNPGWTKDQYEIHGIREVLTKSMGGPICTSAVIVAFFARSLFPCSRATACNAPKKQATSIISIQFHASLIQVILPEYPEAKSCSGLTPSPLPPRACGIDNFKSRGVAVLRARYDYMIQRRRLVKRNPPIVGNHVSIPTSTRRGRGRCILNITSLKKLGCE